MDCVVRNMSQNGARIVFVSTDTVPNEFDLTVQHKGDSRRARIIWRTKKDAGVVFLDNDDSGVISIQTARRIQRLEAERAILAKRVAELSDWA